jgi:hypothetical protein
LPVFVLGSSTLLDPMKFSPEFKQAISDLPSAEKDRLILRLLKKDERLANRIYFELLDTNTAEDRRLILETEILKSIKMFADRFSSPGYLLIDTRWVSGKITEHVKITKDKYGEPYLNLILLINTLKKNEFNLNQSMFNKSYSFAIYVVARVYKILSLIQALHEDVHVEFKELLYELGVLIGKIPNLMKVAINNQLNLNWLLDGEIPEDIVDRQKELRKMGFLR